MPLHVSSVTTDISKLAGQTFTDWLVNSKPTFSELNKQTNKKTGDWLAGTVRYVKHLLFINITLQINKILKTSEN